MTLLDEAKKYSLKNTSETRPKTEEIELFLALIKGDIEVYQARKVIGSSNFYVRYYICTQELIRNGTFKIK